MLRAQQAGRRSISRLVMLGGPCHSAYSADTAANDQGRESTPVTG
jgi:hypothetical protein